MHWNLAKIPIIYSYIFIIIYFKKIYIIYKNTKVYIYIYFTFFLHSFTFFFISHWFAIFPHSAMTDRSICVSPFTTSMSLTIFIFTNIYTTISIFQCTFSTVLIIFIYSPTYTAPLVSYGRMVVLQPRRNWCCAHHFII